MNVNPRLLRDPAVVVDPPASREQIIDTAPKTAGTTVDINAQPAAPTAAALHDAAIKATEDWQANPTPELKAKAQAAVTAAKTAVIATPFVVPPTFKDKVYLKGIDSMEKVFAMLDGAQELIGKRGPAIPKADAPQAEKDAYYESIGRPKTPEEYKIPAEKADPAFLPVLQKAMHKYGLTQDQAAGLWGDVDAGLKEWMKQKGLVEAQADVDFNKLATDGFGAERDKILARGKELIADLTSPAMKPAIAKLDNNALIVLADILRNVDKRFIKQDGSGGQPILTGGTPDELRAKAKSLMEQQGKLNPMSQEFSVLQTQINGIYDQLRKSGLKLT